MPDSGRVSIAPLVASGTDSRSSKVKAYWGKTIPTVRETPTVPTWHRLGWNARCIHQDSSNRPAATSSCTAEHQDSVYGCPRATYARHHTHTHSHSQTQQGRHSLILQQSWVPGMNGAPMLQQNQKAWCSELDGELMHIHKTLQTIQRRSNQRSQQRLHDKQQTDAAAMDTVALRAKVNASVANQIEFFTTIQSAWCNNGKEPGAISEDHIL
ncbi:TPA: hypothetical protein ACH3X3_000849 [Trebouxia sp. C0006]